jgi:hypothetical protein
VTKNTPTESQLPESITRQLKVRTESPEALASKVSPAFRKRFKQRAVDADLDLNGVSEFVAVTASVWINFEIARRRRGVTAPAWMSRGYHRKGQLVAASVSARTVTCSASQIPQTVKRAPLKLRGF